MPDFLSLSKCRTVLGDAADGLTDTDLTELRDHLYTLAATIAEAHSELQARAEDAGETSTFPVNLLLSALRQQLEADSEIDDDSILESDEQEEE